MMDTFDFNFEPLPFFEDPVAPPVPLAPPEPSALMASIPPSPTVISSAPVMMPYQQQPSHMMLPPPPPPHQTAVPAAVSASGLQWMPQYMPPSAPTTSTMVPQMVKAEWEAPAPAHSISNTDRATWMNEAVDVDAYVSRLEAQRKHRYLQQQQQQLNQQQQQLSLPPLIQPPLHESVVLTVPSPPLPSYDDRDEVKQPPMKKQRVPAAQQQQQQQSPVVTNLKSERPPRSAAVAALQLQHQLSNTDSEFDDEMDSDESEFEEDRMGGRGDDDDDDEEDGSDWEDQKKSRRGTAGGRKYTARRGRNSSAKRGSSMSASQQQQMIKAEPGTGLLAEDPAAAELVRTTKRGAKRRYDAITLPDEVVAERVERSSTALQQLIQKKRNEGRMTRDDERDIKRQKRLIKNREAAQLSRLRKKQYLEELEDKYTQAMDQMAALHDENMMLRAELEELRARLA